MHRSLDSATSATGPAACLQSAGCAFRFNGRRFGLRCHDLWSWLDKLAASDCLAGDWPGVLLQLWTQTQQGSSPTCGSGSAQRRAVDGRLTNFPVETRLAVSQACLAFKALESAGCNSEPQFTSPCKSARCACSLRVSHCITFSERR